MWSIIQFSFSDMSIADSPSGLVITFFYQTRGTTRNWWFARAVITAWSRETVWGCPGAASWPNRCTLPHPGGVPANFANFPLYQCLRKGAGTDTSTYHPIISSLGTFPSFSVTASPVTVALSFPDGRGRESLTQPRYLGQDMDLQTSGYRLIFLKIIAYIISYTILY